MALAGLRVSCVEVYQLGCLASRPAACSSCFRADRRCSPAQKVENYTFLLFMPPAQGAVSLPADFGVWHLHGSPASRPTALLGAKERYMMLIGLGVPDLASNKPKNPLGGLGTQVDNRQLRFKGTAYTTIQDLMRAVLPLCNFRCCVVQICNCSAVGLERGTNPTLLLQGILGQLALVDCPYAGHSQNLAVLLPSTPAGHE